ncbi:hypothetical protein H0H81_000610, partial [Sphagnurus paluster]
RGLFRAHAELAARWILAAMSVVQTSCVAMFSANVAKTHERMRGLNTAGPGAVVLEMMALTPHAAGAQAQVG